MKNEDLYYNDGYLDELFRHHNDSLEREELFKILEHLNFMYTRKVSGCQRLVNDELVDGMPYVIEEQRKAKEQFEELVDKYGREQFFKDLDSKVFVAKEAPAHRVMYGYGSTNMDF